MPCFQIFSQSHRHTKQVVSYQGSPSKISTVSIEKFLGPRTNRSFLCFFIFLTIISSRNPLQGSPTHQAAIDLLLGTCSQPNYQTMIQPSKDPTPLEYLVPKCATKRNCTGPTLANPCCSTFKVAFALDSFGLEVLHKVFCDGTFGENETGLCLKKHAQYLP